VSSELSILLVTDSLDAIAIALDCYRIATDPSRVELVVAAIAGAHLAPEALVAAGFPIVRVVDGGDGALQTAEWRAFQAATAPLVVFAQAHAYPRPGFGAAIVAARASDRGAVIGPSMANANPATLVSRVAMWLAYGRWIGGPLSGPASDVPGHSSAYDREVLGSLGDELVPLLEAGWPLQAELAARGHRCFLAAEACVEIVNPARAWPFVSHFFHVGWMVAAKRTRRWSMVRRLAYALASPVIPFVRLRRIVVDSVRRGIDAPWGGLPLLVLGLGASAAGEWCGYMLGFGPPSRFVRRT
jgi:hypothetical protein